MKLETKNMIAVAEDYFETVEHLADKGTLVFHDVAWDDYEDLLVKMESKPGHRVYYNDGVLKIMSPRYDHEKVKDLVFSIVRVYADELDLFVESAGSTTYRRRKKTKGAEPDTSFYLGDKARKILGKATLDLEIDPPPDVVVEIDSTNESWDKFEIYAVFNVPEIWRFDGRRFAFYELVQKRYEERQTSFGFPLLTPQLLTDVLEQSQTNGQTAALKTFRRQIAKL